MRYCLRPVTLEIDACRNCRSIFMSTMYSCLALNKLWFCLNISAMKVFVYCYVCRPPPTHQTFFLILLSWFVLMIILVQFLETLFHFNVLYTFVLLSDMMAFLVFNNVEIECHHLDLCTRRTHTHTQTHTRIYIHT